MVIKKADSEQKLIKFESKIYRSLNYSNPTMLMMSLTLETYSLFVHIVTSCVFLAQHLNIF